MSDSIPFSYRYAIQKGIDAAREKTRYDKSPFNIPTIQNKMWRRARHIKDTEPDRTDSSIIKEVYEFYKKEEKL